jgi:hypothetical protein
MRLLTPFRDAAAPDGKLRTFHAGPILPALDTLAATLVAVAVICLPTGASASFVIFDVPGAEWTAAASMNGSAEVAGYADFSPQFPFIREPDGTVIEFSVPGTPSAAALAINDEGSVAGWGCAGTACEAFLRMSDGEIVTFNPNPSYVPFVRGINNKDQVLASSYPSSFVRNADGSFTNIDIQIPKRCGVTQGNGINDKSAVVGFVYRHIHRKGPKCLALGFLYESDGTVTTFGGPNSAISTSPCCINSKGWIAGNYDDPIAGKPLGFIRAPDGTMTSFDVPNGTGIAVWAMNDKGLIVGWASESSRVRGFLRHLNGKVRYFDAQIDDTATYPLAINSHGEVAGSFVDAAGKTHGFIGTP